LGGLFCGRVGGLGGFLAGLEGIDLGHQPSAGLSSTLFFGLHVGVLAAQVDELAGDIRGCVGLPFQFCDLEL
jgi:hypothetical protein